MSDVETASDGAGLLTRSELAQLAREPAAEPCEPGYWPGSATGEVSRWRDRALSAERELASVRRALARWRPVT